MNIKMSNHAAARMAQRGIQKREFNLFWHNADQEILVGGNCSALSISRKRYKSLVSNGLPAQIVDRIGKIMAVVSGDGIVITVMKDHGSKGQAYRNPNRATKH